MWAECLAGFLAGAVARYFIPDSRGFGPDTLLGIIGGGTAGFIYKQFSHRLSFDQFDAWTVVTAAAGALILIILSRGIAGRRTIAP